MNKNHINCIGFGNDWARGLSLVIWASVRAGFVGIWNGGNLEAFFWENMFDKIARSAHTVQGFPHGRCL